VAGQPGGSGRNGTRRSAQYIRYQRISHPQPRPETVDAGRLTLDAVADRIGAPAVRPSVDVGELPLVHADPVLLRQVMDHLIDNATRFVRHEVPARVTVGAQQDRGRWRIEVADRGIGVPAEHRERIFEPFHRTPAADGFPGTGLGLAICRRIVALHGGEIGVEPNPGGGSVFWFTVLDGVSAAVDDPRELARER
jgi:signal transduction histidine kinase